MSKEPKANITKADFDSEIDKLTNNGDEFPIEVFPVSLQNIIREYSRTTGAPVCFLGGAMLTVAGAALGNSTYLSYGNFKANAIMFMCIVGKRGTGKTHPLDFILRPLRKIDSAEWRKYKIKLEEWKTTNANLPKNKQIKSAPSYPPQFVPTDTTYEAVVSLHELNIKGMLVYRDELTGLVDGFDQYSKGAEINKWLQLFNGTTINNIRKTSGITRIENPHVSLIGGIQPELLPKLAEKSRISNGFLDRFLFLYPEKCEAAPDSTEITDSIAWDNCIKSIHSIELYKNPDTGEIVPFIVRLSEEAQSVIAKNSEKLRNIVNNTDCELDNSTGGIAAKLRICQLRFALILHSIRCGCGIQKDATTISIESANGAVLLTEYFLNTALKVHGEISAGSKKKYLIRRIHKLRDQGKTIRQIAELLEMPQTTVYDYSKLTL